MRWQAGRVPVVSRIMIRSLSASGQAVLLAGTVPRSSLNLLRGRPEASPHLNHRRKETTAAARRSACGVPQTGLASGSFPPPVRWLHPHPREPAGGRAVHSPAFIFFYGRLPHRPKGRPSIFVRWFPALTESGGGRPRTVPSRRGLSRPITSAVGRAASVLPIAPPLFSFWQPQRAVKGRVDCVARGGVRGGLLP